MLTKAQIHTLRSLREKKAREAANRYVVEGPKVVGELLKGGVVFEQFFFTEKWTGASPAQAVAITEAEMARISHFPTPSSVLAVGIVKHEQLAAGELAGGLTLALDGVQDAGNVGTLLRIADWFGFARVLLSPDCADLFSQKVINASMGSFARVRVITVDLDVALERCPVPVLGCDLAGDSVDTLSPLEAGVVVIGSEGRGLSSAVASCLTRRVTIPRFGQAESLNAGVAAGIVCAQLRRTR